jgi:hypothetical protein
MIETETVLKKFIVSPPVRYGIYRYEFCADGTRRLHGFFIFCTQTRVSFMKKHFSDVADYDMEEDTSEQVVHRLKEQGNCVEWKDFPGAQGRRNDIGCVCESDGVRESNSAMRESNSAMRESNSNVAADSISATAMPVAQSPAAQRALSLPMPTHFISSSVGHTKIQRILRRYRERYVALRILLNRCQKIGNQRLCRAICHKQRMLCQLRALHKTSQALKQPSIEATGRAPLIDAKEEKEPADQTGEVVLVQQRKCLGKVKGKTKWSLHEAVHYRHDGEFHHHYKCSQTKGKVMGEIVVIPNYAKPTKVDTLCTHLYGRAMWRNYIAYAIGEPRDVTLWHGDVKADGANSGLGFGHGVARLLAQPLENVPELAKFADRVEQTAIALSGDVPKLSSLYSSYFSAGIMMIRYQDDMDHMGFHCDKTQDEKGIYTVVLQDGGTIAKSDDGLVNTVCPLVNRPLVPKKGGVELTFRLRRGDLYYMDGKCSAFVLVLILVGRVSHSFSS